MVMLYDDENIASIVMLLLYIEGTIFVFMFTL